MAAFHDLLNLTCDKRLITFCFKLNTGSLGSFWRCSRYQAGSNDGALTAGLHHD